MSDSKYFSAAEKDSFAKFTVDERFKKIFNDYCSGNYEEFLKKELYNFNEAFPEKIKNDFLKEFEKKRNKLCGGTEVKELIINENLSLGEIFNYAPFLEAEFIFYHALLAEKGYYKKNEATYKYDFFASEKKNSVLNSKAKFISILDELVDGNNRFDKASFIRAMHYCLSANTSDLSQLDAKERFEYTVDDIRILHDDSNVLFEYLNSRGKKFKQFDIICDNAGKELFSDLYLACYFLYNEIVDKVVFHLKPYPFFVSDATQEDFGYLISEIQKAGNGEGSKICNEYIHDGKIKIKSHNFWAEPLCFDKMPSSLKKHFFKSSLIIIKGDLNYRRLVKDKNWNYIDTFKKRTKKVMPFTPIVAPRVLKSDVLIGISEASYQLAKSTDKLNATPDQRFKGNGKWAVIQFRALNYKHYKKWSKKNGNGNRERKENATCVNSNSENKGEKADPCKKKVDKYRLFQKFIFIFMGIVFLLILAMLFMTLFSVEDFKNPCSEKCREFMKCLSTEDTKRIDFSLLLGGYAVLLSGTIIIPEFLMKKKIDEALLERKDENVADVKKSVVDELNPQLSEIRSDKLKLDADLSRMISFLLNVNDMPFWSLGWAFHSLKRYLESSKIIQRKEIYHFVDLLLNAVIRPTVKNIVQMDLSLSEDAVQYFSKLYPVYYVEKNIVNSFLWKMIEEGNKNDSEQPLNVIYRFIKDTTDVEYSLKSDLYNLRSDLELYSRVQTISEYVGAFVRFVVYSLTTFELKTEEPQKKSSIKFFNTKNDFLEKISSLSKNASDEQYIKSMEDAIVHISRDVFCLNNRDNKRLSNQQLMENLNRIYISDEKNQSNKIYFFTSDDYCYPLPE